MNGSFGFDERRSDGGKVLHVRTKYHGLAQSARLDRVLSAFGRQALADEDYRGVLVEILQFPGRVDKQALHLARGKLAGGGQFASIHELHAPGLQVLAN